MDLAVLFAQYSGSGSYSSSSSASGDEGAILVILAIALMFGLLIGLAIAIVIILLLQGPLKAIPAEHRKIEPGALWLLLIPIFNIFWNFKVFLALPDSFKSYFNSVGRTDVDDCARSIGMWYAICVVCSIVPCVNYVAGPASLVLLVIFLVKMHGYKDKVRAARSVGRAV